jgi:DNA uptake protein ComE-like DNA-binding protein
MLWKALLKETLMIRKSQILTAVALAILLPIAAHTAQASTTAKSKTHMAAATKKAAKMPAVDINSASKEDLMKLNGITDETAEKIIAGRPYKSKAELTKKSILTKAEYAKVRTHIIAKQSAEMKSSAAPEGSKSEEAKETKTEESKENKTETGK